MFIPLKNEIYVDKITEDSVHLKIKGLVSKNGNDSNGEQKIDVSHKKAKELIKEMESGIP